MDLERKEIEDKFFECLMEIGYVWVNQRDYICAQQPSKKMRRFKMFMGELEWISVSIKLWFGTGYEIDPHNYSLDDADSYYGGDPNTESKYIYITLREPFTWFGESSKYYRLAMHNFNKMLNHPNFTKYTDYFEDYLAAEEKVSKVMHIIQKHA